MRVVVSAEARFSRTPDQRVWTTGGPGYDFWRRYLVAFERVKLVARVIDCSEVPASAIQVDGPKVDVLPIPYYVGPVQYAKKRLEIQKAIRGAVGPSDAAILRVSSPVGTMLAKMLSSSNQAFALEVVGDPFDMFAPGVVRHPLRPFVRSMTTRRLKRECGSADAVAYVTEYALQRRYPAQPGRSWSFSDVELPQEAFALSPRRLDGILKKPKLISLGAVEQPYKGIDDLVTAVAHLRRAGVEAHLNHVGGGHQLERLRRQAVRLGVSEHVTFSGSVSGSEKVREHLDDADIFVLPSRTEGLPRALVEAMARGLPAVSTAVGGIPELLPPEWLVAPDRPSALAATLTRMIADSATLNKASSENLAKSRHYAATQLVPRYTAFYRAVRQATEDRITIRAN